MVEGMKLVRYFFNEKCVNDSNEKKKTVNLLILSLGVMSKLT